MTAVTLLRMAELSTVASGFSYLECPRWHDGALVVSDFYTHRVLRVGADGTSTELAAVPQQPSGLGWLPDGRMLVVSMRDRTVLRQEPDGTLVVHADLTGLASWHLNDMVVDERGRAWVGNFGFDLMGGADIAPGELIRVDPDGTATVVARDMMFPNGCVITPDGTTLLVAETVGQRITAFTITDDGALTERREWATFGPAPTGTSMADVVATAVLAPDGMCLDADGAVWVADALGGRVVRVAPPSGGQGGAVLDEIAVGSGVFACMLGGDDGRTLYLCSAPSFAEHERRDTRDAVLLSVRVDAPAAGRP